jgi:hypothetical protein
VTIAISVKVNDGIVLASDSATTVIHTSAETGKSELFNIYNHAKKIFRLHKDLPIAAITWGTGNIGPYSLKILTKEFRTGLMSRQSSFQFDPQNYSIEDVAKRFKKFIFDDNYQSIFANQETKPFMGFMMAGYSSNKSLGELWRILIGNGECNGPAAELLNDLQADARGQDCWRCSGHPKRA